MSIISLLSDFGYKDPYVAEMKAVILSINPQAQIVDISHEIKKFDIRMGAYFLASAAPYFLPKTIHVSVVDPGVGTKRRPIIVETNHGLYVGPDNGILMLAANKEVIKNVYTISNRKYMLTNVSKTFHGRDIFGPAAAHLSTGIKPSDFGPAIYDYLFPKFSKVRTKSGELHGEILHIDDFGNIISNISAKNIKDAGFHKGDSLLISLGKKTLNLQFCSAYDEVHVGGLLTLIDSSNFLEVAVNQGFASKILDVNIGDTFRVSEAIYCKSNSTLRCH